MFGFVRALQIVPVYDLDDGTALINLGRISYVGPRGTAGLIRQGVDAPAYWVEAHILSSHFLRPRSWMHCAGGIGRGRYDDIAVLYIDEVYGIWRKLPLEYRP
ncbi:hypothetical protein [Gulosibacter sediminis]|uniref:hypothetical protein n=1 Tax=Gulosibacter sediminis TaxID=1729695 RepID=UPI0024A809D4|nr:hypothetical protein [Gulosibacter sediminis]